MSVIQLYRRVPAGVKVASKPGNARVSLTMRGVRLTTSVVENEYYILHIVLCVCILSYPACEAHATFNFHGSMHHHIYFELMKTSLYHLHVHIDAPEDGCELHPKHVERKKSVIKH